MPGGWAAVRAVLLCLTVALLSPGYALVGAGLLFLGLLTEAAMARRGPWVRTPLDGPILGWVGAVTISSVLSPHPELGLPNTALLALGALLGYYPLARTLEEWPGLLRPFYAAWVGGGVAAGTLVVFRFLTVPGGRGDLPELGFNAAGTVLLVASLAAFPLFASGRSRWHYLAAAAQFPILAGLLATQSRGAWLGWSGGILALLVLSPVGTRRMQWRMWALVLAAGLGGLGGLFGHPSLQSRTASILSLEVNRDRLLLWQASLQMFRDHPWWGVGLGAFVREYPRYRLPGDPNELAPFAHNLPLSLAAETGLVGLLGFSILLGAAVKVGVARSLRGPPEERMLRAGAVAQLLGVMVHQLVDGTLQSFHLGFVFWFLLAVMVPRTQPGGRSRTRTCDPVLVRDVLSH